MDKVARLYTRERSELFSEVAAEKGVTPAVIEKDFWVTWVLKRMFEEANLGQLLMLKGGTSLSKVYHLIQRFSEDIDLVLDWRVLCEENPLAQRSKTKQAQFNAAIIEKAQHYIDGELLNGVEVALDGVCNCRVDPVNPQVIEVSYPKAFTDDYLRSIVRLEIGPLASWLPYEKRRISCYAAEVFPESFEQRDCAVKVIKVERTFWEKVTILHHEAHRPRQSAQPPRYSRHYYDLAKMAQSSVRAQALSDLELLDSVVKFKRRFYPRGWARYELAKPGTLVLAPEGRILTSVRSDYQSMRSMIFGEVPDFDGILIVLRSLQEEINALS